MSCLKNINISYHPYLLSAKKKKMSWCKNKIMAVISFTGSQSINNHVMSYNHTWRSLLFFFFFFENKGLIWICAAGRDLVRRCHRRDIEHQSSPLCDTALIHQGGKSPHCKYLGGAPSECLTIVEGETSISNNKI